MSAAVRVGREPVQKPGKDPYPKDTMLSLFGECGAHLPSLSTWRWR